MAWLTRNAGPLVMMVAIFLMGFMFREILDMTRPVKIIQQSNIQSNYQPETKGDETVFNSLIHRAKNERDKTEFESTNVGGHIPEVLQFSDGKWETDDEICKSIDEMIDKPLFQSLTFHSKSVGNFPIYVHDTKADSVSTEIRLSGTFEPGSFATIAKILEEDPEVNVIDVGTNIGVLSIQFAKMGRKVISLEAATPNIQHYCASIRRNKLQDKVTIIHNAVMDNHEPVKFILGKGGEFGVSFVDGPGYTENKLAVSKVKKFDLEHPVIIKSLTLDDLLTLPNINLFKKVFLKLDTEGLEDKVLLGAKKLFQELDVKGIFMEWRFHKTNADSRKRLLQFMEEQNFAPYNLRGKERILLEISKLAPHDILWLRR